MPPDTSIREYNRKRDFSKSSEPRGRVGRRNSKEKRFLIQKHAARRLHYDFRLEWEGVLKSWAVTKGPSLNPEDKRLAVRTEDHPLAYGDFEGTIPAKEYGGGTVMLWDTGSWEPEGDVSEGLKEGKLKFHLHGERLSGGWTLVRMRRREGEKRDNWLLIKERDEFASDDGEALLDEADTSVVTGRTMNEIANGEGPQGERIWHSNKSAAANVRAGAVVKPKEAEALRKKPSSKRKPATKLKAPRFVEPQLATRVEAAPAGGDWLNEVKFDGYRLMVSTGSEGVTCYTRSGLDWTEKFPDIAAAIAELPCRNALIDGEAVALADGSAFSALQEALQSGDPITLFAFDLLDLDGEDLRPLPLIERKAKLKELLEGRTGEILRYSEHIKGRGKAVIKQLCGWKQEGMIAKRADAPYRSGRTKSWLKIKCTERQEFVIGGYTPSDKAGRPFASIILGTFEGDAFIYRGRVGTGFNDRTMSDLAARFEKRKRKSSPFATVPADMRRKAVWLRPDLVAEIDFTEFTRDGHVRHGVFQGLRQDKEAKAVTLETEQDKPDPETLESSEASAEAPSTSKVRNAGKAKTATKETGTGKTAAQSTGRSKAGTKTSAGKRGKKDEKAIVAGITISHPDRVIYEDAGITKLDLAEYYAAVAPRLLVTAANHPVSLVRCPEGDIKHCFFQKHANQGFPKTIPQVPVKESSGKTEKYMALRSAEDIVALVQMGTIEFHIWGSAADRLDHPDRMVFDLDPDEGLGFDHVVRGAVELRGVLEALGLKSLPMVTGGKGVHVVVPLERRADFDRVKAFAKGLAQKLEAAAPKRYVSTMSKAKRKGRIFIDWLRNDRGATAITPYAVRSRPGAPVATPITWEELETIEAANVFTLEDILARIEEDDPWAEAKDWRQSVTRQMLDAVSS